MKVEAIARRRDRVVELTREGHSASAIAAAEGITIRSVQRIRNERGIAQPRNASPMTVEEKARAAAFLDDGCSYGEVARTLRRSTQTIRKHFPGRGWTPAQGASLRLFERRSDERAKRVAA